MSRSERIFLIFFSIVSIGIIIDSYIPRVIIGRQDIVGPSVYPRYLGCFLLVTCVYSLVRHDILKKILKKKDTSTRETDTAGLLFEGGALGLLIVAIAYALLLRFFGFFAAGFLLLWVSMYYMHILRDKSLNERPDKAKVIIKTFLITNGVMIFIYLVFGKIFNIYIPQAELIRILQ